MMLSVDKLNVVILNVTAPKRCTQSFKTVEFHSLPLKFVHYRENVLQYCIIFFICSFAWVHALCKFSLTVFEHSHYFASIKAGIATLKININLQFI
jgi:hypothetical protein